LCTCRRAVTWQKYRYTCTHLGSFNLETSRNVLLATSGTVSAAAGGFSYYSVTFTPLGTDPNLGDELRIVLTDVTSGAAQANFDAISLTAVPEITPPAPGAVPEPGAMAMFSGIAIAGFGVVMRRRK